MVESKERRLTFRAEGQLWIDAAAPIDERVNDPINGLWGLTPSVRNANRVSFPTGLPRKKYRPRLRPRPAARNHGGDGRTERVPGSHPLPTWASKLILVGEVVRGD